MITVTEGKFFENLKKKTKKTASFINKNKVKIILASVFLAFQLYHIR